MIFFTYTLGFEQLIKYVWSIIAFSIEANCRPESREQYDVWINHFLSNGKQFHSVELAARCAGPYGNYQTDKMF
jgi:hypothetical protein